MNWHIQGGRILTDGRLATGDLSVAAGILSEVRAAHAPVIDAGGLLVSQESSISTATASSGKSCRD